MKWSADEVAEVPPPPVTVRSAVPVPAGATAVSVVAEVTVKEVAGVVPNDTPVAPVRLVPVTVTEVPPACGPVAGETPDTTGARLPAGALPGP